MMTIWLVHRPTGAKLCVAHGGTILHQIREIDDELHFGIPLASEACENFIAACGGLPDPSDLTLEIEGEAPLPV